VEAAHARGLVHCDLSADNLVLTRDARGERQVKVLDFGASAVLNASLSVEERACGMVVGSPAFISPEQWSGEAVDGRADLYSLGVVGYLLVTGRLPFGMGRVGELAPPHPQELNPGVPPALSRRAAACPGPAPDERFPDARAFREALVSCLATIVQPASPLSPFINEDPLADLEVVVDEPILLEATLAARGPEGTFTLFGQAMPADGATPLHLALREASQVSAPCWKSRRRTRPRPRAARARGPGRGLGAGLVEAVT
jgi:serine/threonine-protein kinase